MEAADILDAMADELETNGHVKCDLGSIDGPKCVLGALNYVISGSVTTGCPKNISTDDYWNLKIQINELLGIETGSNEPFFSMVEWNNGWETTDTEVIDTCRHAAKRARNG